MMRDFFNEDEVALLEEICKNNLNTKPTSLDQEQQIFNSGVKSATEDLILIRNVSSLIELLIKNKLEIEDLSSDEYVYDEEEQKSKLVFLSGKSHCISFVLNHLIVFRWLKGTLDLDGFFFLPKESILSVAIWRNRSLGQFRNLKFNHDIMFERHV